MLQWSTTIYHVTQCPFHPFWRCLDGGSEKVSCCAWSLKTLVVLRVSLRLSLPALDPSEHFVSADESMAQNTPSIRADHRALSCSIDEDLPCTQPLSKWMQNVQISPPLLINWGGNYVRAAVRPDASDLCSQSHGGK